MILYHGTTSKIGVIDLNKCRLRTDFGRGFYMTDRLGTARDWAIGKPSIDIRVPTVIRYNINEALFSDKSIKILKFDEPSKNWLDFVKDNRRNDKVDSSLNEPRHCYDIVCGPIANDKVFDVVIEYCNNLITAEEAIPRLKALPSVIQISFHTTLALSYILSASVSQRENKKWTAWEFTNI